MKSIFIRSEDGPVDSVQRVHRAKEPLLKARRCIQFALKLTLTRPNLHLLSNQHQLTLQPLPFIYLNHLPGILLSIFKSEISYSVKLAESTAAWAEHFRLQDSLLRFAIERPLNRNRSNAT